jgi:hypothetical protein
VTLGNVFSDGSVNAVCSLVSRLEYCVCCGVMSASKVKKNVWPSRWRHCEWMGRHLRHSRLAAADSGCQPEKSRSRFVDKRN